MVAAQSSWEGQRAEALAKVFLTRNGELDVFDTSPSQDEIGADLIVRPKAEELTGAPLFAVEVKATRDDLSLGKQTYRFKLPKQMLDRFDFPLMLLVVDLRKEEGHYAWLIEPSVDQQGIPVLSLNPHLWSPSVDDAMYALSHSKLRQLDPLALQDATRQALEWHRAQSSLTRRIVSQEP